MTTDTPNDAVADELISPPIDVEFYHSGMALEPSTRKFAPTGTRGWLFHHTGVDTREVMRPLRRSRLARMTRGRFKSTHLRNLSAQRDHEHWDDSVLLQASKWFEILPQGFRLRARGDVTEDQMNKILRAATELMLHPVVRRGKAVGSLQFRLADGNFFVATWNSEKGWFDIRSGAVVPVLREGSAPWKPSNK